MQVTIKIFGIKNLAHSILSIGGMKMNKNDGKDMRKNAPKGHNNGSQPEPLSGSKKVKNRNHTRQKHNSGHDM